MIEFDNAPSKPKQQFTMPAMPSTPIAAPRSPVTATGGGGNSLIPPIGQRFAQPGGVPSGASGRSNAAAAKPLAAQPGNIVQAAIVRTPDRIKARKIKLLERRYAKARLAKELAEFQTAYASKLAAEAREAREAMTAAALNSADLLTPGVIRHWQAWREDNGRMGFEYVTGQELS